MARRTWAAALVVSASALGLSCGDDGGAASDFDQPSSRALFRGDFEVIELEIDYARGAEPFTGEATGFGDIWRLFGDNAARLFEGTGTEVRFPTTLDGMEALDISGDTFDSDDILALAREHRGLTNTASRATFYVLWLDGLFRERDGTVRDDVLGVSIGDTGVIAMFKPVIADSSSPLVPGVNRFVEQTTLVHEFGHAVGLVNNGVPLTSQHHDAEHGAHCTSRDCVMFFANEGAADLRDFVVDFVRTGQTVIFGDECLADTDAL